MKHIIYKNLLIGEYFNFKFYTASTPFRFSSMLLNIPAALPKDFLQNGNSLFYDQNSARFINLLQVIYPEGFNGKFQYVKVSRNHSTILDRKINQSDYKLNHGMIVLHRWWWTFPAENLLYKGAAEPNFFINIFDYCNMLKNSSRGDIIVLSDLLWKEIAPFMKENYSLEKIHEAKIEALQSYYFFKVIEVKKPCILEDRYAIHMSIVDTVKKNPNYAFGYYDVFKDHTGEKFKDRVIENFYMMPGLN